MTILLVCPVVLFIIFSLNTCKRFIFNYFTQNGVEVCGMCGTVFIVSFIIIPQKYFFHYSFKIFSRFWLVKTTRVIHHNQLLFTKFGKNLRHIESMTSKVERLPRIIEPMTSKVQPAADYWTVDRENLGTRLCYIWWAEKQRE